MKKFNGFVNILAISLLWASISFAGPNGGVIGNGGDEYAIQFVAVAQQVVQYLEATKVSGLNIEKLKIAVQNTKVESTSQKLMLHGLSKDAINYPSENRILFSRKGWDRISDDAQRAVLVFHEYLGILDIDDTAYKVSKVFLKNMNYGRASGFKAQDALGPEVIRTTIRGQIAKKMYLHLDVPVEVILGIDGEQKTKFAKGIECAVMSDSQDYTCYFDVSSVGIE